jgi:signal transduction histidine kinase
MAPSFRVLGIRPADRAALARALGEDARLSDFDDPARPSETAEVEGELAILPVALLRELVAARAHAERLEQMLADQRAEFQFLVHDLAGHATVVYSNVEYLAALGLRLPDAVEEAIADSHVGAQEIRAFVEAMLAVAQADEVGLRPKLAPVALGPLLQSVAASFARRAEKADVSLVVDVANDVSAELDGALFRRVVANLLANALRYSPRGGAVRISAEEDTASLRVIVQNQGSPVPEALRGRLFEKFSPRAEADSPWRGGIGLHFCRRVMEAHGGRIEIGDRAGWAVSLEITLPCGEAGEEGDGTGYGPVAHSGVHFRGGRARDGTAR